MRNLKTSTIVGRGTFESSVPAVAGIKVEGVVGPVVAKEHAGHFLLDRRDGDEDDEDDAEEEEEEDDEDDEDDEDGVYRQLVSLKK